MNPAFHSWGPTAVSMSFKKYPKLIYSLDAESLQEKVESEPSLPDRKKKTQKADSKNNGKKDDKG